MQLQCRQTELEYVLDYRCENYFYKYKNIYKIFFHAPHSSSVIWNFFGNSKKRKDGEAYHRKTSNRLSATKKGKDLSN